MFPLKKRSAVIILRIPLHIQSHLEFFSKDKSSGRLDLNPVEAAAAAFGAFSGIGAAYASGAFPLFAYQIKRGRKRYGEYDRDGYTTEDNVYPYFYFLCFTLLFSTVFIHAPSL